MSATLTTAQLIELTRSPSPPQGFVPVPAERLALPDSRDLGRINYQAFFNSSTNDLVITGTPRTMERLDLVTQKKIKDTNIFSDSVRITNGPKAGGFARASDPVTQTEALARQLTDAFQGTYPNATVSFAGEGAVGLAFSAASHELRSSGSAIVGSTVTLNAWTGHWTPDGSVDTGVLDVRTPHPANGDPAWAHKWPPGAIVAAVNTGNAQLAGGLADIGTQSAMALGEWVAGKVGGRVMSEGAAWMADKIVGKGAEAMTAPAADAASGAAANYIDSPGRAIAALGWQANLTPAETIQVLQQGIGQGQWNVMQGLSPAGYAVDGVYYEHTGPATVAGVGSSAETRQPAVQVTTWRDDTTGAIMEARLSGRQVDGVFEAGPSGVFASGMDTAGRMVLKDEFAQRVADYQMRPAASTAAAGATPEDATLAPVVVEGGRGLGNYTTVSIQTHADGAASFEFVGEDGSRAWVMQDAATGNRAVVINSGKDVEGEPRTVLYDLDRHGRRIGQERYVDAAGAPVNEQGIVQGVQAPAQPEPIPHITTHEQRITPTPGGMTFAEAHQRRDEPEQISPSSLQPVGKLASPDRQHELTLLREIGIVNARVKEELGNAPKLHDAAQPSLERTQQRAQEPTQDLAPRRTLKEAVVQPVPSPEMKAVAPQTMAPTQPTHAPDQRVAAPAPSQTTTPSAPDSLEMHARLAAKEAELAAAREQIARLTVQGFAVPQASESPAARAEPAAPARQPDPRNPAHPDHKDFQKIFDVLAQDGRWNAQQSTSIASQALADFKGDRLAKRLDVVLLEPDTRGQLKLFVGHAPWGGLRCLSVAAVDPVQAARVPPEQSFERLEQATQMAQQRELQDAQRWGQQYQQQQGNAQGLQR